MLSSQSDFINFKHLWKAIELHKCNTVLPLTYKILLVLFWGGYINAYFKGQELLDLFNLGNLESHLENEKYSHYPVDDGTLCCEIGTFLDMLNRKIWIWI